MKNNIKHVEAIVVKDNKIFYAQRNFLKSKGGKWEFLGSEKNLEKHIKKP